MPTLFHLHPCVMTLEWCLTQPFTPPLCPTLPSPHPIPHPCRHPPVPPLVPPPLPHPPRFMSLMCHEVRTPLNGCLASAEMLLETPLKVRGRRAWL
jgi:hypothetical protein